jgi:translocator protein
MTLRRYALWFVVVFAAAGAGANFLPGTWYAALRKPPWNPPNWVFGPVWTLLYIMMAWAAAMISGCSPSPLRKRALGLFCVQLVLNSLWSFLFFGLRSPGIALGEICLMWLAIGATLWHFARLSTKAAGLLIPYGAWVTFAAVLNGVVWRMNAA